MIAQVDGDEADSSLDQAPGQQRLFAPVVVAVTFPDPGRFPREIEGRLGPSAGHNVVGLLSESIHRFHLTGGIQLRAQAIHLLR
jgi:hypothetical protein